MTDELVEMTARALAPLLEGGREFDQMPPDRTILREWYHQRMCDINDATQDDALAAARAVIPLIYNAAIEDAAMMMDGFGSDLTADLIRALAKP